MRLLTHNFLKCSENTCSGGYPLIIKLDTNAKDNVQILDHEMNVEFVKNVLQKIDYEVLCNTAKQFEVNLNREFDNNLLENESFLSLVHHALFKIHIMEGSLICPKCNISFPIKEGIPNMLTENDKEDV